MAYNFQLTTNEIANIINGKLIGNPETLIKRLNRIEYSESGDITFLASNKFAKYLSQANPSCVIMYEDSGIVPLSDQAFIIVNDPYQSFVNLINYVYSLKPVSENKIHSSAIIHISTKISDNVMIGAGVVIGKNCSIGKNVKIHPNVTIYDDVIIGDMTEIHSNVVICSDTIIGSRCLFLPGAVIGSEGFGFIEHKDATYERIPQIGNVIIEDDVEIGSNTTIDRAMIGNTIIKQGVKLDNLIQIAHNCIVGENSAMAAQVGLAGSTTIGKRNRFGGQVGLAGHIETEDDVILYAQSGSAKGLAKGIYFGSPARSFRHAFKIEAILNQLPEIITEFNQIKRKLIDGK